VGCGQGPVARALASSPGVGEVVGIDPSPIFVEKAREQAAEVANLSFMEGDARAVPLEDRPFDVVIFHTTLCHVPRPELALVEAARVLRPTRA
jgi:ubiquinone/menaquinone biosynthesis C-methylase UbiE